MEIEVNDYYVAFEALCEKRWEYFSKCIFDEVPKFISSMFADFLKNPLCLSITSILLFMSGVVVLRNIIRSLRSWGV